MFDLAHAPEAVVQVVSSRSAIHWRHAVERFAYYFKREGHYDFVQYHSSEDDGHDKDRAVLWKASRDDVYPKVTLAGAAMFRWRMEKRYAMAWVWLHPYERRRGHLSESWPWLTKPSMFGEFDVEGPISEGMTALLRKLKRIGHKSTK